MRELGGFSSHGSQSHSSAVHMPPPKRRRRKTVILWSVAVATVAGAAWLLLFTGTGVPAFTPVQLTHGTGEESEPAISPDGNLVAYTSDESGNQDVWLFDLRNRSSTNLTQHASSDRHASWAADGSSIYFVSDRNGTPAIWQIPLLGGPPTRVIENAEDVAASPDGTHLAFVRTVDNYYRVFVAPLASPRDQRQVTKTGNGLWDHRDPKWSPDSSQLCYLVNREIWVVPASSGEPRRVLARGDYDLNPTWSSDGRALDLLVEPGRGPVALACGD